MTSNATIGQDLAVGRNLTVAGNITTTTGDIVTVSGDVVAGGIRLDSSTGRVTGVAAGVANTDAVNVGQLNSAVTGSLAVVNARIDTLSGRVDLINGRISGLEDDARKAFQGVAMGFAMNAAPLNLANGEGGISAGAGIFEGEYAGAIRAQFVTETGFGIGATSASRKTPWAAVSGPASSSDPTRLHCHYGPAVFLEGRPPVRV